MTLPIELIRSGDEPVAVRINGREFACEEETHNTVVPKRFLTRVRLSEIPDEITIKPVKSIDGNVIHVENDIGVSAFHDGVASIQVEEMFRRKFWDGEVGLSPYVIALREAISQSESASEADFNDNDDDYVFLCYEITVTENLEISDAIEFVDDEIARIHQRADQLVHRRRDGLLGIFDRGSLNVDLRHALGQRGPVALVMADIDHFKKVNDRFGHPAGDTVLRAVAKVLSSECDGHHSVEYRYGGEELAIVVTGDDVTNAPKLAEAIRADVEGLRFEVGDLKVTVSLGVAEAGEDRDEASLVKRADAALYRAKKEGRNRVREGSELTSSEVEDGPRGLRLLGFLVVLAAVLGAGSWLWMTRHVPMQSSDDLGKQEHDAADLGLEIVNPTAPAVNVVPLNSVGARDVKEDPLVWDLDLDDLTHSLRINEAKFDWIRPDQRGGPFPVLQSDDAKGKVKPGHRILGFISVTCPLCKRVRYYWIYFVWGQGGWYSEIPEGRIPLTNTIALALPEIRRDPETFFAGVPQSSRKLIAGALP